MTICIISGSSQSESQSRKVSEFIRSRIEQRDVHVDLIDLHELNLPSYNPDNDDALEEETRKLRERLRKADGFVLISPEWDGMVNHRIISFLHYVDLEMADKPVMLVGVSSTYHGGHYPVEQMRMLGPKNKHYVIIPEHLVVMNVKKVMNSHDLEGDDHDVFIKKRADYAVATLIEYARALEPLKSSSVFDYETYPNGM